MIPRFSYAQSSPWENAVNVLRTSFTGPIARGLSLVAIVVGGLLFAFGEGDSKRALAGIVFGVGMAVGAVTFMGWLFPYTPAESERYVRRILGKVAEGERLASR